MIEAKNFRLGNIAATGNNKPFKVVFLDEGLPLKGVPITKEYLEEMGFLPDENGHWWMNLQTQVLSLIPGIDGFWYPKVAEFAEMSHQDDQVVFFSRKKYIHELQNFVYEIADKELTITIKNNE